MYVQIPTIIIRILLVLCLLAVPVSFHIEAASRGLILSQPIFEDSEPPTTPAWITATPIVATQIDVMWGVSTDNYELGGYQVFRDAVQVATTTLTSFSDTGLTAGTIYSYTVRAFDSAGNFSTTTNPVATTTPQAATSSPPTPTPTSTSTESSVTTGSGIGRLSVDIEDLTIESQEHSALLSWKTNQYTQYSLRWGRTGSYELGYVATDLFARSHSTSIGDLEPGTIYEYELIAHDKIGRDHLISRGQFQTLSAPDTIAPSNVSDFKAQVIGDAVRLSWTNPDADDLAYVRIVRNFKFYPQEPYNGYIVYQGDGESIMDQEAFIGYERQYYTAFVYDKTGNISSGAILVVTKHGRSVPVTKTPDTHVGMPQNQDTPSNTTESDARASTTTKTPSTGSVQLDMFTFDDIVFIQDGVVLNGPEGSLQADGSKPVTVQVPYEVLPEHLKSIVVTFTHPANDERAFTFLLRINKEKTAYEAVVAPFYEQGLFKVTVAVFDYKDQISKEVTGFLNIVLDPTFSFQKNIFALSPLHIFIICMTLSFVTVSIFYFIIARRRRRS